MNALENYLNAGVAKSGVPLVSWFGPYSVTSSGTFFNHNLHNASGTSIVPDLVVLVIMQLTNTLHVATYDPASMSSTQVKLIADTGLQVGGIALKF